MFCYQRQAQYHETDQMGIIHHSNYVKWMEEARGAYLSAIGTDYNGVEKKGIISPVVSISLDYKKPVEYEDRIEIALSMETYNGIVMEFSYRFYNRTKEELCTEAKSRHCFLKDGRVISLKKLEPALDSIFREQLEAEKETK